MKTYAIMIALLWASVSLAQEDQKLEDCKKYKSLYYQYLRQKMYPEARGFWLQARENCSACNQLDYKIYKNGRVIYAKLRKDTPKEDSTLREGLTDSLLWVYDEGLAYVKEDYWAYEYAAYLIYAKKYEKATLIDSLMSKMYVGDFPKASQVELYFLWKISNRGSEKTRGLTGIKENAALDLYRKLSIVNHRALETKSDSAEYWNSDMRMRMALMKIAPRNDKALEQIKALKSDRSQFPKILESQLERDMSLLEMCGKMDSEYYSEISIEMLKEFPTSFGFSSFAHTSYRLKKFDLAIEYFQKAIEATTDSSSIDIWNYKLALSYYGAKEYKKAFKFAKKVMNEHRVEAMKLCGDCIAAMASGCGNSTFERKANYWLANDYYRKAKALGMDVSAAKFLNLAPTVGEVFDYGLNMGDSFHLDCWNERTVIR